MLSNGRNTQALRLQQFTRTISKFRNRAMAIRFKPSTKRAEMGWTQQRSVPNQCSNIRSFSGPSLSAHAEFHQPRIPKPRVLTRRDFYFKWARIVIVTHRSAKERECRPPRLPRVATFAFVTPNFTNLTFVRDSWRQKNCFFFSQYLAFLGGSWRVLSDWCLRFLNILLSVIRNF